MTSSGLNVMVVGAAGRTGRAVVDLAVEAGHHVTALIRHDVDWDRPGVAVVVGDARDPGAVEAAVAGQDAVIDTVSGTTPYRRTTLEASVAAALIAGMQRHGVRRLIVTSALGVGDSAGQATALTRIVIATYLRASTADKARMEELVRASGLDWTITRPAVLTDQPATGRVHVYAVGERQRPRTLTRADLAAFLVAQLVEADHVGRTVTLGNPAVR